MDITHFKKVYLFTVCICVHLMCVNTGMHVSRCMWRPEDTFQQLVLTLHLVEAGSFVSSADLYSPR